MYKVSETNRLNNISSKNYLEIISLTTEKDLLRIQNFNFSEIHSCNIILEITKKTELIAQIKKIYD